MILINIKIKTISSRIYFTYIFSYVARADKYTLYLIGHYVTGGFMTAVDRATQRSATFASDSC